MAFGCDANAPMGAFAGILYIVFLIVLCNMLAISVPTCIYPKLGCIERVGLSNSRHRTPAGHMVSRSFGEPTNSLDDIRDAITMFASRASEKLRSEGLAAGVLTVFANTNRFRPDLPQKNLSASVRLFPPGSDGLRIVRTAIRALEGAWEDGPWMYTKAGVMMADIVLANAVPTDLFSMPEKPSTLMTAMDKLNQRYGRETVSIGLHEKEAAWRSRAERLSPDYTGRWSDIPVATAKPMI